MRFILLLTALSQISCNAILGDKGYTCTCTSDVGLKADTEDSCNGAETVWYFEDTSYNKIYDPGMEEAVARHEAECCEEGDSTCSCVCEYGR